jgi:hypothetical protein
MKIEGTVNTVRYGLIGYGMWWKTVKMRVKSKEKWPDI